MNSSSALHRARAFRTLLALICVVALGACGSSASASKSSSSSSPSSSAASAPKATGPVKSGHVKIEIKDYAFVPAKLTVKVGTKITFTNYDQTAHTATSKTPGVFDTGTLQPGHSATVTLKKAGTFPYYCQFHAFMTATITVVQ